MPQGATTAYAAPEVLYSLRLQFDPQVRRDQVQEYLWINGASADWWSLGIVLFELLTGELSRLQRSTRQTQTRAMCHLTTGIHGRTTAFLLLNRHGCEPRVNSVRHC